MISFGKNSNVAKKWMHDFRVNDNKEQAIQTQYASLLEKVKKFPNDAVKTVI
jgi:hypothetical protein